jgi:hypothetical protein
MVALALYRHKSIGEVLDDLGLAIPSEQTPFVSKSAAAQARQRVGPEPLKWLFDHAARNWVAQDKRAYLFKGLQLFAMDGTTLRTHDTEKNREHFGAQGYAGGTVSSYPQIRGVTLTALPTHLVHSAAFGPYGTNEMLYAKQLIDAIPDESLTVCRNIVQPDGKWRRASLPHPGQVEHQMGSNRTQRQRQRRHCTYARVTASEEEISGTARILGGARHHRH